MQHSFYYCKSYIALAVLCLRFGYVEEVYDLFNDFWVCSQLSFLKNLQEAVRLNGLKCARITAGLPFIFCYCNFPKCSVCLALKP